ncbi:MAG: tRNA (adenosine(37)-N6)-threonylcarbamoyltransferase complex transferase subunit TsaD [Sphingomonadales bacterium]
MAAGADTIVLGIETSCDETAAAVITGDKRVLAETVYSQIAEHRPYGGVVPEIAARSHIERLDGLIAGVMKDAGIGFDRLSAVAATAGPGLIGGVIVGLMTGKAIAATWDLPLIAVNHLEGHALSARLTADIDFPYLLLLVSGGHCQLIRVSGVARYQRLGATIDDAVGEAFDKTAKLLELGYPGGPEIEKAAKIGDPDRFELPRPMRGRPGCDFSFSGLKTAVRRLLERHMNAVSAQDRADIAASFQGAVADVLCDRTRNAMEIMRAAASPAMRGSRNVLVVAGGVAANTYLKRRLDALCREQGFELMAPPAKYCTDNGAMIAWAGIERLALGLMDGLDVEAKARWPLDPAAAQTRRIAT